jgi:hypothetical protein
MEIWARNFYGNSELFFNFSANLKANSKGDYNTASHFY